MKAKKKILVLSDYFLPGYRAGGPIRSLQAMLTLLRDEFEFVLWTRRHDLGSLESYSEVDMMRIRSDLSLEIQFFEPPELKMASMAKKIREGNFDVVYLNSFFSWRFSGQYLFMRWLGLIPAAKLVLAPRGELSPGALQIKSKRKMIFLLLSSWLNWHKDVIFQVSNSKEKSEALDLLSRYRNEEKLFEASDLILPPLNEKVSHLPKKSDELRIVFLSRISPMKNLELVLESVSKIESPLILDIYGPVDMNKDSDYFRMCQALMDKMPSCHKVRYLGEIEANKVLKVLEQYHVLFLPSRGENFGHIIIEALQAGCLPLLSNKTPWNDLAEAQAGIIIDGDRPEDYLDAIKRLRAMNSEKWAIFQSNMNLYLKAKVENINQFGIEKYKLLF